MAKKEVVPSAVQCLGEDCPNSGDTGARGLCRKCYAMAGRAVKGGKTTWARLEAAGRAFPSVRQGASPPAWLSETFVEEASAK